MKECVVIGGGFAGLTSAAYLSKAGIKVELLEASPKLGGRAYSFIDKDSGSTIDNGQHIMMGCYKETLKFLRLIKADKNLIYQKRLKVNFVKENFNVVPLESHSAPYPLNLILALLKYKALSINDRFLLLKFFLKLSFVPAKNLKGKTIFDWLQNEKQNDKIQKAFWDILAVGALNTNINSASAEIFRIILHEIFLSGNFSAAIILPKYGLSDTYCNASRKFIENNGGNINLLERVLEFKITENRVTGIITDKRIISGFDYVISAIPLFALDNIKTEIDFISKIELAYSSILSIHIWLKENKFEESFYGLINSKVHWVFNHEDHLTLVISDAGKFIEKSKEEIIDIVISEMEKYFRVKKDDILSYKIIKEKRATFIPANDILNKRPEAKTNIKNFYLAGDWTNTGLPSTIESAVKSGNTAANLIIRELENNY
jgi:squalene-associated FAD-dependent desaturase